LKAPAISIRVLATFIARDIGKSADFANNARPDAVRFTPRPHPVVRHLINHAKETVPMKKLSIMLAALLAISAGAACQKKEQKPAAAPAAPAAEAPKPAEGAPAADAAKPAAPAEKK
jgi:hypothetical protein